MHIGSMRLTHKKTVISPKLCTHFWSNKLSHKVCVKLPFFVCQSHRPFKNLINLLFLSHSFIPFFFLYIQYISLRSFINCSVKTRNQFKSGLKFEYLIFPQKSRESPAYMVVTWLPTSIAFESIFNFFEGWPWSWRIRWLLADDNISHWKVFLDFEKSNRVFHRKNL